MRGPPRPERMEPLRARLLAQYHRHAASGKCEIAMTRPRSAMSRRERSGRATSPGRPDRALLLGSGRRAGKPGHAALGNWIARTMGNAARACVAISRGW